MKMENENLEKKVDDSERHRGLVEVLSEKKGEKGGRGFGLLGAGVIASPMVTFNTGVADNIVANIDVFYNYVMPKIVGAFMIGCGYVGGKFLGFCTKYALRKNMGRSILNGSLFVPYPVMAGTLLGLGMADPFLTALSVPAAGIAFYQGYHKDIEMDTQKNMEINKTVKETTVYETKNEPKRIEKESRSVRKFEDGVEIESSKE